MAVKDQSCPNELAGHPLDNEIGNAVTQPLVPESMQDYFTKLKKAIDDSWFLVVENIEEDGLYVGKRAIRGAQGQGDLLNQAGTVFYHTVLYVRANGKTAALDFGPQGNADVTANVMEAVPCAPVLHENAVPDSGYPLIRVRQPHLSIADDLCSKAMRFAEGRKYHAINNNCIQNTDFFCRVLTSGKVRNAPMVYDLLAGKVPSQDHPMLLLFFMMTRLSWFHVCDGSPLTNEFLDHQGLKPKNLDPEAGATARKPSAQSRLEEQNVDLLQLVHSAQQFSSKPAPSTDQ